MKKAPIIAIIYPTKAEIETAREKRQRLHALHTLQNHLGFQLDIGGEIEDSLFDAADQVLSDVDIAELAQDAVAPRYGSLENAFNTDGDFLWVTHKGDVYLLADMATPHLFYSLRMLYNHSVPPVFRVVGPGESMKRYNDVPDWDAEYRTTALRELASELNSRDDLDDKLQQQYDDIIANSRVIVALGI